MPEKYTKEQFWKLYEKLPQELKDALFSEETGNYIYETCKKNGIEDKLGEVVESVGQVLLGVLPIENFQENLEKELKLKKEVAKKVFQEINRFIFFPLKESLTALYGTEIIPTAKPSTLPPEVPSEEAKPEEKPTPLEKPDIYREPIE